MLLFFITIAAKTDIFWGYSSSDWDDPLNWSLGRKPIMTDNVEMSPSSIAILYQPNSTTRVASLLVRDGSIISNYNYLSVPNIVNRGTMMAFADIYVDNLIMDNGLIWTFSKSKILTNGPIYLASDDEIMVGPNATTIIKNSIVNAGTVYIAGSSKLYVNGIFRQSVMGRLVIWDVNNTLFAKNINIQGTIDLRHECQHSIQNRCYTIIDASNSLNFTARIISNCKFYNSSFVDNRNVKICFGKIN